VHELAHVIDYNAKKGYMWFSSHIPNGLSEKSYMGWYGAGSNAEFFAEAVTNWVFDSPDGNPYHFARARVNEAFPQSLLDFLNDNLMVHP
jgi:hypothetical protein